ncbi:ATP-binding protein [Streptomyces sp. CAU 1734]|uniref:ATP-binding protein n=1 Tax=Streptomyces sp. CAU 1734 TaxID=3140360 RepID=UPI003260EF18
MGFILCSPLQRYRSRIARGYLCTCRSQRARGARGYAGAECREGRTLHRIDISFLPDPIHVQHMRRLAVAVCRHNGLDEPEVIDSVRLVVTEIITNAIVHGEGHDIRFTMICDPPTEVVVEVDDHAMGIPVLKVSDIEDEQGRGLFLIDALSSAWGRKGTATWCVIPARTGAPRPARRGSSPPRLPCPRRGEGPPPAA